MFLFSFFSKSFLIFLVISSLTDCLFGITWFNNHIHMNFYNFFYCWFLLNFLVLRKQIFCYFKQLNLSKFVFRHNIWAICQMFHVYLKSTCILLLLIRVLYRHLLGPLALFFKSSKSWWSSASFIHYWKCGIEIFNYYL